jgi:hypothetical protein
MIIITNIPVNGRAGRMKGNIWMYVGGGGDSLRDVEGSIHGTSFHGFSRNMKFALTRCSKCNL